MIPQVWYIVVGNVLLGPKHSHEAKGCQGGLTLNMVGGEKDKGRSAAYIQP